MSLNGPSSITALALKLGTGCSILAFPEDIFLLADLKQNTPKTSQEEDLYTHILNGIFWNYTKLQRYIALMGEGGEESV